MEPCLHAPDAVSKRSPTGQLDEHEVDELIPAAECTGPTTGGVAAVQAGEFVSRYNEPRPDLSFLSDGLRYVASTDLNRTVLGCSLTFLLHNTY